MSDKESDYTFEGRPVRSALAISIKVGSLCENVAVQSVLYSNTSRNLVGREP